MLRHLRPGAFRLTSLFGVALLVTLFGSCDRAEPLLPVRDPDPPHQSEPLKITLPLNEASFAYEESVAFQATATRLDGNTLVWKSDRDGVLESGHPAFHTESLSVGRHVVTVTLPAWTHGVTEQVATVTLTVRPS